jgi:hypothetical protein
MSHSADEPAFRTDIPIISRLPRSPLDPIIRIA